MSTHCPHTKTVELHCVRMYWLPRVCPLSSRADGNHGYEEDTSLTILRDALVLHVGITSCFWRCWRENTFYFLGCLLRLECKLRVPGIVIIKYVPPSPC